MTGQDRTKTLITTSMLAALIFVITFLIAIPVPMTSAYVNIGDSVIYCAGMLVGAPWAAVAAGIGSMLADWAVGVPIYMPATLIIKALMGFVCAKIMRKGELPRFVLACVVGGAIMVVGYGAYEAVFMGGWGYVTATVIANTIQWAGGVAGAIALYYPVKRIRSLMP